MKSLSLPVILLLVAVLCAGCTGEKISPTNEQDRIPGPTPALTSPAPDDPTPTETTSALPPETLFRSDRFRQQAMLPAGWASAEGPQSLARPFTGQVAFNSWGEAGFWAPESVQDDRHEYSPDSVFAQIPASGVYVVLVEVTGGPVRIEYGPEYEAQNLGGLLDGRACGEKNPGQESSQQIHFYKWARQFRLEVYCGPEADARSLSGLEELLKSWRFDNAAAGDVGWAMVAASRRLPEAVAPDQFIVRPRDQIHDTSQEGNVLREVYAGLGNEGDGTIYIEFKYYWDFQPLIQSSLYQNYHTWSYQVTPDGEVVWMGESGPPLPEPGRPTPTPLPLLPALEPGLQPPSFLYFHENQVLELLPGGEARPLAALPELGKVHAATRLDDEVILLRARGLQRANLIDGSGETLVEFPEILYGDLLVDQPGRRVFYSATIDNACSGTGFAGRAGYYNAGTETHVDLRSEDFSLRLLGPSIDGRSLYVLPVGCDPSFGPIWSISLETGQKEAELATQGENLTLLSPSGRYFATLHARVSDPEQPLSWALAIYDLEARPPSLREIELPEPGGHIWYMFWSPDSHWLSFTLLSQDLNEAGEETDSYGIWRVEAASGKVYQAAPGREDSLPQLEQNGKWLLLRHAGDPTGYLIDMETGQAAELSLPYPSIPSFLVQGTERPSHLSPDGNWLLVWHLWQGQATITHLPSGAVEMANISEGAQLIGWK